MIMVGFNELKIGTRLISQGRTITETDVVNFCMLTGNWLELHANAEFAKTTVFGQRIVQGSLVFSITNVMLPADPNVMMALYGVDKLRFLKPTFIGDTLHAEAEIIRLEPRSDDKGIATGALFSINQRAETVMRCEMSFLVRNRPDDGTQSKSS
jgi:acyl dehydratase